MSTRAERVARARYAAAVKNAASCETATEPRCRCFCGGKAHGAGHREALEAERHRIERESGVELEANNLELFPGLAWRGDLEEDRARAAAAIAGAGVAPRLPELVRRRRSCDRCRRRVASYYRTFGLGDLCARCVAELGAVDPAPREESLE